MSSGKVLGKDIDLGVGDALDLFGVAGDHGGFAADAHLAHVEIQRRAAHLDDQIGFLDDLGIPLVRFDAGEMHAGFDQVRIIDDDLNRVGAGGDDVGAAHDVFRLSTGMILMPSFSPISSA